MKQQCMNVRFVLFIIILDFVLSVYSNIIIDAKMIISAHDF